jgi:hypothetical protein
VTVVQVVDPSKESKALSLLRKWSIDGAKFVALERGASYSCPACMAELGAPYHESHSKECELMAALKEGES